MLFGQETIKETGQRLEVAVPADLRETSRNQAFEGVLVQARSRITHLNPGDRITMQWIADFGDSMLLDQLIRERLLVRKQMAVFVERSSAWRVIARCCDCTKLRLLRPRDSRCTECVEKHDREEERSMKPKREAGARAVCRKHPDREGDERLRLCVSCRNGLGVWLREQGKTVADATEAQVVAWMERPLKRQPRTTTVSPGTRPQFKETLDRIVDELRGLTSRDTLTLTWFEDRCDSVGLARLIIKELLQRGVLEAVPNTTDTWRPRRAAPSAPQPSLVVMKAPSTPTTRPQQQASREPSDNPVRELLRLLTHPDLRSSAEHALAQLRDWVDPAPLQARIADLEEEVRQLTSEKEDLAAKLVAETEVLNGIRRQLGIGI